MEAKMNSIIKYLSILLLLLGPLSLTKVMAEEPPLSCSQYPEKQAYRTVYTLECTATEDVVTVTDIIIDRDPKNTAFDPNYGPCQFTLKFGQKGRCRAPRKFIEAKITANGLTYSFTWKP